MAPRPAPMSIKTLRLDQSEAIFLHDLLNVAINQWSDEATRHAYAFTRVALREATRRAKLLRDRVAALIEPATEES